MRRLIIKILFRLLKIPVAHKSIDHTKRKAWIGLQYPLKEFQDYILTRNLHILQVLGGGVARNEDYWILIGQRIELGRLLSEAKMEFEKSERKITKKHNENIKNKKS